MSLLDGQCLRISQQKLMTISKRSKSILFFVSLVLLLMVVVDIPRILRENTSGSLRKYVLRTAEVIIPLKDLVLGRTVENKLARLQSTGACQFCDLTEAIMIGLDLSDLDLRNANLGRADLSGANLSGAYLRNADLTGANLTGANLNGAKLDGAILTKANLIRANLSKADLYEANLNGADMGGANLIKAELFGAKLNGADLESANLEGANLNQSELKGANLYKANLFDTDVIDINLSKANLEGANLRGLDLTTANLSGANLREVNLEKADLGEVDLSGGVLVKATLMDANLDSVNLTGANLSFAKLRSATMRKANLFAANLVGANLSNANLEGATVSTANLEGVNLNQAFLFKTDMVGVVIDKEVLNQALLCYTKMPDSTISECNLSGLDLREFDLRGLDLKGAHLVGTNLEGVNLGGLDLTMSDLSGANLKAGSLIGADLTDANLVGTNLTGTYLYNAILVNANLSQAILVDARLSGADLTGANLRGSDLGGIDLKRTDRHLGEDLITIQESGDYSGVTSFELNGDKHYLTTKSGILYELWNGESTIVLDLNNNPKFTAEESELGLMGVSSNSSYIYISYTIRGDDVYKYYLVVDEFSKAFDKVRTIVQIGLTEADHHAGTLAFDSHGKLYLSVGDGEPPGPTENQAQNLNSLTGKILRFDVARTNPEPQIVAYGLRNPWKISIDAKNRMFIGDCGSDTSESTYLLDDLYPTKPYNLGWPVFEGTKRRTPDPLLFRETLAPIHEYTHYSGTGICVIGGFFLETPQVYLFGDLIGTLRLLKQHSDGKWYEEYFQRIPTDIWSFGYDKETKQLFISGSSKIVELTISREQINLLPRVELCRTTMPDGSINNSGC